MNRARTPGILLVVLLLVSGGCRDRAPDDTASAPAAADPPPSTPALVSDATSSSQDGPERRAPAAEPEPTLESLGRVDVDGFAHGIVIDALGHAVSVTRQGRAAAYLVDPAAADLAVAPPSLELETWASRAVPLAPGLFAVILPDLSRVELVRAPGLERAQQIVVQGAPADAALALDRLWLAVRQAPEGRGLVALDPTTGAVLEQLPSGETPVALALAPARSDSERERLLALLLLPGATGELVVVSAGEPGVVERVGFEGTPLDLVAPTVADARAWIMRHDAPDLLPIELADATPSAGTPLALPFVPRNVVRGAADADAAALFVAHGDGRLARVELDGAAPALEAKLGSGATELAAWPGGELLLVLDPQAQALVALDAHTLEERARTKLGDRPGRMVIDAARSRVYVTLPQRQEIEVLAVRP